MTEMGVILGTAAYMSPEQAKGRQADKRSDVWAFGAVLYEMLSGRRAFKGDDISDTLAAVLRQDVDWTALPASTPASVRHAGALSRPRRLDRVAAPAVAVGRCPGRPSEIEPKVYEKSLSLYARRKSADRRSASPTTFPAN